MNKLTNVFLTFCIGERCAGREGDGTDLKSALSYLNMAAQRDLRRQDDDSIYKTSIIHGNARHAGNQGWGESRLRRRPLSGRNENVFWKCETKSQEQNNSLSPTPSDLQGCSQRWHRKIFFSFYLFWIFFTTFLIFNQFNFFSTMWHPIILYRLGSSHDPRSKGVLFRVLHRSVSHTWHHPIPVHTHDSRVTIVMSLSVNGPLPWIDRYGKYR